MNSPPALDGAETQLEARNYFERKHINQILESIVTGLTFTKPDDPLAYIEDCVQRIRKGDLLAGKSKLQWDLFIPASSHKDIPRQKTSAAPQRSVPPLRKKVHPQLAPIKQQAAQAPFMMPEISSKPLSKRGGGGNGAGKGDAGSGAAGKIAGEERTDRPNIRSPSKLETASVPSAGVLHLMATPSATELSSHQTEGGRPATETLSGVRPLPPITHHMDVPEETTDVEVSQVERPDTPAAQLTTAEPVPEEAPAVQTAPEFEITPLAFKGPAWDNIVFVLGGPGCGKGTNCVRLAKDFNYTHLSAGDLLRAEVATGSDLGKELENLMKEGKIVPMHVTLRLLREAMEKNDDADGFLIDGFPRQLDQAEAFEKQAISSVAQCKFVLYFECTEELLERRLLERGKTSGRADDNIETIKKRFNTFLETSLPVINRYVELGKCIKISSEPPMEEVYQNVRKYFDKPKPLYHNNVVFMLGGPGSGKGTQCERLAKEFHLTHLSTGDLLRAEIEKGSDIGKAAEDLMKEGLMVPSEVILRLLRDSMEANKNTPGFLIDGFPRAMDQAQEFERMIGPCRTVVYFHCSLEVLEQRLLERGKTSGRLDDNLETIKKRFHTFENQSMPVIEHYKKKGKCVQVSSEDTIDGVYNIARQLFIPPTPISHPNIIFMLGGPGCGKGTQCKKLAEEFQLNHVSTGDLLRAEVANGTAYGRLVERCMQEGQLAGNKEPVGGHDGGAKKRKGVAGAKLPLDEVVDLRPMLLSLSSGWQDVVLDLLNSEIVKKYQSNGFLIDGFPRAMDQALEFERTIGTPRVVLFFQAPFNVLKERLLGRGKSSGRADDKEDVIVQRFQTFKEESMPVIRYYQEKGLLVKISSVPTVDEVYHNARKVLTELPAPSAPPPLRAKTAQPTRSEKLPFDGENIAFVLGGPGSGKGTQCDRIVQQLQWAHLSTGDLLREEVKKGTDLGRSLEADMKEGKMVPLEVTMRLLSSAMEEKRGAPGFLIDGFPRTMEQATLFEQTIGRCTFVLFFDCPNEILTQRLLKRGETSGRADDNLESIQKRLKTFEEASMPVIEHFKKDGRVKMVLSDGNVDDITAATLKCFENL